MKLIMDYLLPDIDALYMYIPATSTRKGFRVDDSDRDRKKYLSMYSNDYECMKENIDSLDYRMISSRKDFDKLQFLHHKVDEFNWYILSENESAVDFISQHIEKINWYSLYMNKNKNAMDILRTHPDKINWYRLSGHENAIDILRAHPDKIDWYRLSRNENAIDILRSYPDKIIWCLLFDNKNALDLLKENKDKFDYDNRVFGSNPDKICWKTLSYTEHFMLIIDEIKPFDLDLDWEYISTREDAIDFLTLHQDKIRWKFLSVNKKAMSLLNEYVNSVVKKKDTGKRFFWRELCSNVNAMDLLLQHIEYYGYWYDWGLLCTNKDAIPLLRYWIDRRRNVVDMNWNDLSANENAYDILVEHEDKIDWDINKCMDVPYPYKDHPEYCSQGRTCGLYRNPNIVKILENLPHLTFGDSITYYDDYKDLTYHLLYDYCFYKKRMDIIREELMMVVFHPKRLQSNLDKKYCIFEDVYLSETDME